MGSPDRLSVRESVALMGGYHSPQLDVAVRLNTNESPVPPPEGWAEALRAALAGIGWHRYPDRGAHELRAALAKHEQVAPEQVFAANGSNEVLQCLLLAFGGPNRIALTFEPTYALHSHIARLSATQVASGEREEDFSLDADYASAMVADHRPAVTFLCSPNNPTGMVEPPELVERLLADVSALPGLLLMDEAYGQFDPHTSVGLIDESRPLAVAHLLQDMVDGRGPARLSRRPVVGGGRAGQGDAALPLGLVQADRRSAGAGLRRRDERTSVHAGG